MKTMKTITAIVLLIASRVILAAADDDFVITVKTNNPGGSPTEFVIPAPFEPGFTYNYNVDCNNDGALEATAQTGSYTCTYTSANTYTIRIKDNTGTGNGFPRISFSSSQVNKKILAVEQWGTGTWRNVQSAFRDANNLVINATDTPNFSNVRNMNFMFDGATLANPDTSNWNTSEVTSMWSMFDDATSANPDTSNWDTSAVTNMSSVFFRATSANPDTSNWNTSAVTNMASMFFDATSANPDASNWDISAVTLMSSMFFNVILPTPDYDAMLIGFARQNLQSNVSFNGGDSEYCSTAAINARASIVSSFGWNITDGGLCFDVVFINGLESF